MYESLHNHTTSSDGLEDHLAVLETARLNKIKAIAFTDHDALPDDATILSLQEYTGPVAWTVGIEVSSGFASDHEASGSLHIIGHFVDVKNEALLEHCRLAQESRIERMVRIVDNLTKHGFIINEAECLQASGGESVGRPHIVTALLSHPENHKRLEMVAAEMSNDKNAEEQYQAMRSRAGVRGIQEYVYALLLGNEPYIKGVYVDYLYITDMDESVRLIRNAGGVALLAHWWTYSKKLSLETVGEYLKDKRLDGIETIGGTSKESADAFLSLHQLAQENDCLVSVGADAHKPADFERYIKISCANKSTGVLKTLYERVQPKNLCANLSPLGIVN